jgi:integrase
LAAKHMATVADQPQSTATPPTIVEFFERDYLPWCEQRFADKQLKAASLYSLKQIWRQHLSGHFADRKFAEYETHVASKFLTDLARKYARATVAHVRSAMSGIFSYAINASPPLIKTNPIADVKVLTKYRAQNPTQHYTLEELENGVTALVEEPELQLIVCLAGFAGLRPNEIETLKWPDFDAASVHVRRGIGRGVIDTPKTEASVRSIPLVSPVLMALEAWRAKCGDPKEGWVFPGRYKDRPGVMSTRTRKIEAIFAAKHIPWKTLYAGRRAASTILTQLTGNPLAAAQLLGHKTIVVTMTNYIKQDRTELMNGVKLLEEKLK